MSGFCFPGHFWYLVLFFKWLFGKRSATGRRHFSRSGGQATYPNGAVHRPVLWAGDLSTADASEFKRQPPQLSLILLSDLKSELWLRWPQQDRPNLGCSLILSPPCVWSELAQRRCWCVLVCPTPYGCLFSSAVLEQFAGHGLGACSRRLLLDSRPAFCRKIWCRVGQHHLPATQCGCRDIRGHQCPFRFGRAPRSCL